MKNSNQERKRLFVDMEVEAKMHRTEWCAAASEKLCMRCARSSENMKMPRKCRDMWGPKAAGEEGPQPQVEKMKQSASGRHDMVRRVWCGKCSGCARCRLGPKLVRPLQEHGNMFKIIFKLEEGAVPDRNAEGWNVEGENGRVTREACKKPRESFGVGDCMAHKSVVEHHQNEDFGRQRSPA